MGAKQGDMSVVLYMHTRRSLSLGTGVYTTQCRFSRNRRIDFANITHSILSVNGGHGQLAGASGTLESHLLLEQILLVSILTVGYQADFSDPIHKLDPRYGSLSAPLWLDT